MNITREEIQQELKSLIMSIGDVKECQENTPDIFLETAQIFKEQIKRHNDAIDLLQSKLAEKDDVEPDVYQYQSRDGEWKDFINKKHFEDTLAEGSWPIRALYTHPVKQPMTDSEIDDALSDIWGSDTGETLSAHLQRKIARAIEARMNAVVNG